MNHDNTSPWISIKPDSWLELTTGRTAVLFKKNTMIFHEGESSNTIYIVKSGRICITCFQQSGAEKQLYIAEQGSLFGESSCFSRSAHSASAVAIVDSGVYCICWDEVQRLMQSDWTLTEKIIQMLCRKKAILQKQVVELSFADSLQRIAQMLANLGQEYGEETADGIRVSIRFTHQDVANLTNTSRVTVSNIFQILSGKGVLTKKDGHFYLGRLELLQQMADGNYTGE